MAGQPTRQSTRKASGAALGIPPWWKFLLAGLAYAVLGILAFPPAGLWPVALIAPMPLIWAGCRARGALVKGAFFAALGSLPLWVFEHMYLLKVTPAGYPILCVYLAVYVGLMVIGLNVILRSAPRLPAAAVAPWVWVGLEMLRGEVVFTGYPWFLAGQPLIDVPILALPAAAFSVYGLSLPVVAIAAAIVDATGWSGRKRSLGGLSVAITIVLFALVAGLLEVQPRPQSTNVRMAVVQTNIPQDNKLAWPWADRIQDFKRMLELTRQAALASPKPDVILWPETMFPGFALDSEATDWIDNSVLRLAQLQSPIEIEPGTPVSEVPRRYFADELLKTQADLDVPMIVGAIAAENLWLNSNKTHVWVDAKTRYNSAFLIFGGKVDTTRYDKIDLTPFGEFMPYVWRWKEIQQQLLDIGAGGMEFNLAFGKQPKVMAVPVKRENFGSLSVHIAAPICFEATKPLSCRRLAMESPQGKAGVLVNLSNDGWFAEFPGRHMHLLTTRWRCVELGLPMVRAVNTGISCFIDAQGRVSIRDDVGSGTSIADTLPMRVDGVFLAQVPIVSNGPTTFFARYGYLPLFVLMGLLMLLIPISRWPSGQRTESLF